MKNEIAAFVNYANKSNVKVSLAVTIFSVLMLIISLVSVNYNNDNLGMICFFSLIIEFLYGVILSIKVLKNRAEYLHLIPFLFLNWFIGCFCANIFINVFENLPVWVYVVTFLFCLSNFFVYSKLKNKYAAAVCYFINGFSLLLIVYFMMYLIPFIPISLIGIFAIGIGFYGLVPLIVFVSHSYTLGKEFYNSQKNLLPFSTGIIAVIVALTLFTFKLNEECQHLNQYTVTKSFESNDDLPNYIVISQNLNPNFLNEILLKKDIVYVCTDNFFEFKGFDTFGEKQFNERKIHNPFINVAYLFSEDFNLSQDDRINILKSNFDKRLETEEQLWSGTDLITKNIKEDIKIYSNDRLAYTEITMDVVCDKDDLWDKREAIYSFQLPEGSVATSLSLWVNGIERKGVLTTKEKAQNAYRQIVGVEARDPSLMQWKEGNKVVVRVFPISYKLPRTFKCGFTTPLKVANNQMSYQSLNIKGPNISNAETISRIQMVGNQKFTANKNFQLNNGFYTNKSKGLETWEAIVPIDNETFSRTFVWKDNEYRINKIEKETSQFTPSEIILDLNSFWTTDEVKAFLNQKDQKYFTYYNNQKQEINDANYEVVLSQFINLHYSLLPLYLLHENSLVVTKCGTFSANFEELEASDYLKKIKSEVKQKQIRVINISEDINPFWQTIKEQKYVEYSNTNIKSAIQLINNNQFISLKKPENSVAIEPSNICIQQQPKKANSVSNGSNHIYRMYAFGKVLEEQVKIQQDSTASNPYVTLAKDANIVTPISSLIVLETDEDYKKNGIEKNVNTLGNANINEGSAAPIGHRWILIVVALILAFFYFNKIKLKEMM
ncbi:XrtN system VIT domain-containing protein [Flavobacterium sp.]|uniref:XrtN system VIT domain-containing protein n=1 Tax=Flavobacterium sp. TaxID=239 RepID=UPI00286B1A8E|nr:XrtN system VIT domain-containing protein [Flavobacterium sp.]